MLCVFMPFCSPVLCPFAAAIYDGHFTPALLCLYDLLSGHKIFSVHCNLVQRLGTKITSTKPSIRFCVPVVADVLHLPACAFDVVLQLSIFQAKLFSSSSSGSQIGGFYSLLRVFEISIFICCCCFCFYTSHILFNFIYPLLPGFRVPFSFPF